MRVLKDITVLLSLLVSTSQATTQTGTVEIDPEVQSILITDWGYDIKNASVISSLSLSKARDLFIDDRMSILRISVWGEDNRPAHPGPGEIDTSYYVFDGTAGSLKMFTAMKNVRDTRPDVIFFASKKLDAQTSFPAWTKDAGGVIPEQYARLLADYFRFMEHDTTRKSESFVIPILGVDNEIEFNEGNITPEKHIAIVNSLLALSQQTGTVDLIDSTHATNTSVTVPAAFTMPIIIGPERYTPSTTWVDDLLALPGGDATLDLIGTHYYPNPRPYSKLADTFADGDGRVAWNSEVHWDDIGSKDDLGDAESALAAIFDCIDIGLSGYSWWAYTRTGFKGEMEKAITTSTAQGRQVSIDDEDGYQSPEIEGSLITRAFRQGSVLQVWALNNTETVRTNYQFNLLQGDITGDVTYKRWLELSGSFSSSNGIATFVDSNTFSSTLPANSITLFTLPYRSPGPEAVYLLDGDTLDSSTNGQHGTAIGGTSFTQGRRGQAASFNGIDRSISIPRTTSDEFTIAFWMRTDQPGPAGGATPQWWQGNGLVDGKVSGVGNDFGISLVDTKVTFGVGSPSVSILGTTDMSDGQWRHVAATRNAWTGEMELFINGRLEASTVGPTGTRDEAPALRIGSLQSGVNHFEGSIDDVRIHNRVLDPSEIQELTFFDATPYFTESWEGATPGFLVGTSGSVQADNLWNYNGRNRLDWGIAATGAPLNSNALCVTNAGSNNSSTDLETPLPKTIDPSTTEWVTLEATFVFNALTTNDNTDSRLYAVDNARQNGYGIMARSESDRYSPILLRVFANGAIGTVSVGAVGSQETGVAYEVSASFKRVNDSFTRVRYRVLKAGAEWEIGEKLIGRSPAAGSLLEKAECSQQKNAYSYIDDLAITLLPDLRDLNVDVVEYDATDDQLNIMVNIPELGAPFHLESATTDFIFSAESGSTFYPDVSPWRKEVPIDPTTDPARFFRVKSGIEP